MKKIISYALFAVLISMASCDKDCVNPTSTPTPSQEQSLASARATVTKYIGQEESYFNECCGEDIQLTYNVNVTEMPDGSYRASLYNLSGYGITSGTPIHGANAQGVIFNGNNVTQTFSTVLNMGGCLSVSKIVFHITVDAENNLIVVKDSFKITCPGN